MTAARTVILHADDVGMCHGTNTAFVALARCGGIDCGSVMVPCPWFPEIAHEAAADPALDLGIHLTLTSEWFGYRWGPIAVRTASARLTDDDVSIKVEEVKRPELDAQLVADNIAFQLAQRISHRRAMKKAVTSAMRMGAEGIKIQCGGRLGGNEISRTEGYHEGRVPLHTLRADIDFARSTSNTTFGTIGVKVWIFKGEVIGQAGRTL